MTRKKSEQAAQPAQQANEKIPEQEVAQKQNNSFDLVPTRREKIIVPPFCELTKILFGEPKSGKTTFASGDSSAMFLATEPGQDFIQSPLLSLNDDLCRNIGVSHQWEAFQAFVRQIYRDKRNGALASKGVKSVVIDIVDNLYGYCLNYVCKQRGISYPPENDFGKTWKEIRDEWETWLRRLMDQVNVTFITHCGSEKIELVQANGITKEVTRWQPTFKGTKPAQYLDGVVNCIGHVRKNSAGAYTISFAGGPSTAAGDRTGILERLGEQPLDWQAVNSAYELKARDLGLEVKSKWN